MTIDELNSLEKNKKQRSIDELAKLFVHLTDSTFESATRKAVNICFAIKYALAVAVYILLKNLAGPGMSELWIAVVAAFGLYNHELYINFKVKEQMVANALAAADTPAEGDTYGKEDKECREEKQDSTPEAEDVEKQA